MDPYETITRALSCMLSSPSMREAVLAAVRLGGDTDTVAALIGGLLGCGHGTEEVRQELDWLKSVHLPESNDIHRLAEGLKDLRVRETHG
jgi:ADP-ribosylglycohydrolase